MQLSHTPAATTAIFDDPNLIGSAGLVPILRLAETAGLAALADEHLSVPSDKGAHAGAIVVADPAERDLALTLDAFSTAVADALDRYFASHPEYALGDAGRRDFITTGQPGPQSALVAQFWGEPLTFEQA